MGERESGTLPGETREPLRVRAAAQCAAQSESDVESAARNGALARRIRRGLVLLSAAALVGAPSSCGSGSDDRGSAGSAATGGAGGPPDGGGTAGAGASSGGASGASASGGVAGSDASADADSPDAAESSTWTGPPSCANQAAGAGHDCGANANEDCCEAAIIPGGTFNRDNNPTFPATVSAFKLDRFEATVGRFRAFVSVFTAPKPGAGAHPKIAGSGWDSKWDDALQQGLTLGGGLDCGGSPTATWTSSSGPNERKPMTCVNWYLAFAFCAWDGGRLPTEAEWNYAAAGGNEQREYPWGVGIGPDKAAYDCTADGSVAGDCGAGDILRVGSRPAGAGRWGNLDLSGNVSEWVLDRHAVTYPMPCNDCAALAGPLDFPNLLRSLRGGNFGSDAYGVQTSVRDGYFATSQAADIRCARD